MTSTYRSLYLRERLGEGQKNCRSYFSSSPYEITWLAGREGSQVGIYKAG